MAKNSYNILKDEDLESLRVAEPERFQSAIHGGAYLNLRNLKLEPLTGVDIERLNSLARIMRGLIFVMLEKSQSGHPGGSSSKVEQFLALTLGGPMAWDALRPKLTTRDRVVWSAGHCSPALHAGTALIYQALKQQGIKFDASELRTVLPEDLLRFRHVDGPQGHVESYQPLADVSTGSSGHGLSAAGGIGIVHKSCGLDTKVWVLMGDAETEEGMSYESRNLISTLGATNVIVSLDYNHFGIDGNINEVIQQPYLNYWLALGWNVIEVDGHNFLELIHAYNKAKQGFGNGLPTMIMAHGIKGKCYGELENSNKSHGSPVKHEPYVELMKAMGFGISGKEDDAVNDLQVVLSQLTETDQKYVADRVITAKKNLLPEAEAESKIKTTLKGRPVTNPLDIRRPKVLPPELVFAGGAKVATRKATQAWFEWLMRETAFFYAGTGDLSCSILTDKAEAVYGLISKDNPFGRGIRFGIAEQNMAMWSAGLTQDILPGGYRPVSVFSSYGVFTSMMANSVRMALIGNHVNPQLKGFFIMLAAHDGPETGEDGPTHHGLYWMSLFNAYPGIKVYKPLDANETIEMLFYALEQGEPIALSVCRPDVPVFDREKDNLPPASEAINGAYVFKQFTDNGKPKIVLVVAGGQTMFNTQEALPEIAKKYDVKIIAVTSVELFEELKQRDPAKAENILSAEDRKVAVSLHNGWPGYLYPFLLPSDYDKRALGINDYLKSGPPAEVYQLAGLTAEDIVKKVLKAFK